MSFLDFCDYIVDNYDNSDGIIDDQLFVDFFNCYMIPYAEKHKLKFSEKTRMFIDGLSQFSEDSD